MQTDANSEDSLGICSFGNTKQRQRFRRRKFLATESANLNFGLLNSSLRINSVSINRSLGAGTHKYIKADKGHDKHEVAYM
jgi:hypothetical protein